MSDEIVMPFITGPSYTRLPLLLLKSTIDNLRLELMDSELRPVVIDLPVLREDTKLAAQIGPYWQWKTPELAAGDYALLMDFTDDKREQCHRDMRVLITPTLKDMRLLITPTIVEGS